MVGSAVWMSLTGDGGIADWRLVLIVAAGETAPFRLLAAW